MEDSDEEPFAAAIGPGYVCPSTGLVITGDGRPVSESVGPAGDEHNGVIKSVVRLAFVDGIDLFRTVMTHDVETLADQAVRLDTICPLSHRYINYYHWLVETVPRIRYARAYENRTDDEVTYLLRSDAPPYVDETLNLLGIPENKVERATGSIYRGSRVVVPAFPARTASDYRWIRNAILEKVAASDTVMTGGKNVYISRANAIERRIVNEGAVIDSLSTFGFEPYLLEERSVAENVRLFHEADAVIGVHGAGLTDLIYCDDATVFELFGAKVKGPYRRLADTIGVQYQPIQCRPASTDVFVDIDHLERTLTNVLDR
ncbi:glycosyltransferase family 61 protein [Halorubrum vacuolatum]|uniref:glycosyltransferase family 61 protein n=1 Tax=Halorubrum vacuolatum TaxID=63740 RepID=UPI0015C5DAC3|nr:glycosyltransferase family 61 protein [Halorubrum vacuolatum]